MAGPLLGNLRVGIILAAGVLLLGDVRVFAGNADVTAASSAKSQITGVVQWADGRPLVHPKVELHRWGKETNRWLPAEKFAVVGQNGKFAFADLPAPQYWCLVVRADGAGLTMRPIAANANDSTKATITLHPAASSFVVVRDDQDRPLVGAKVRAFDVVDGTEGTFSLRRGSEIGLGLEVAVSDESGRLSLPPFPVGAVLKSIHIDHPNYVASLLTPDAVLQEGEIASCKLDRGFPVQLRFVQPETRLPPPDLAEVSVRLLPNDYLHDANSLFSDPFPTPAGRVEFCLGAGLYQMLWVKSEQYQITPMVSLNKANDRIRMAAGEHDQWTFRALPKVWVRGRVVTDEGKPVPKTDLSGEIENLLGDGSPVPEGWVRWAPTEWAQTNEQGEYQIRLAPGKCRINYSGEGLPSVDQLSVMVDGTTEQRVPDIVVRALPKIRGMVVGLDGRPVHRAIVRPHSNTSLRYKVKPQLTDEKGEFEFSLPHLPANLETGERVYEHQVFAYLPHESVGGVTTVDLRNAKAAGTLTIRMLKQPAKWPLSAMRNAFNPWEQGDASSRPDRKLTAKNAAGIVAPELDGNLWLNTEKRSLADFRGKYVFLDFYTTWCGPCAGDFSSVKMVHDLFHDQGVAIIGVHDNSSAHDVIRDHAIANGMDIPIVVDHPDGRILKSYQEPGLVPGYPGYLLLDRDGRLITADFTTPGPLLRVYKVELVRQLLLQAATR